MTAPGASSAQRFAEELQRLYLDAGSPEYRRLIQQAASRQPPVVLSDSSLSDWLNGKSVPSNQAAVRFLVTYLQGLVSRRTGQRAPSSVDSWLHLHRQAKQDRRAKRGGRPSKRPAPPAAPPIPPELAGLLRLMNLYAEEHPYGRPGQSLHALSTVYVSQSVASPVEARRQILDPELDEVAMVEEDRRVTRLAQPFDEVFGEYDHFVIDGAAGLGKSTLGRILVGDLVGALLDGKESRFPDAGLVPVILPARILAKHVSQPWGEALRDAVNAEYGLLGDGVVAADTFLRPIAGRDWLVVIDALDEIPDQDDRDRLLKALSTRMMTPGSARFLVTSRPLVPGEIAQLQGPRVGFFELQPFDAAALEAFAQRHFNSAATDRGAAEAAAFLSQIRLAGLDQVITVPLLATVAAQVFTARRRDQPLPSNRYELYEAYIAHFATRNASAAEVFGVGADPELCAWLDTQRTVLLETLAVEYTRSETPLADVAVDYVRKRAPMPPAILPGWETSLGDWLSRSGVLGRHGVRLRFRHQTFAEHLAATARARELPAPFGPADPAWRELISQFLLEDVAAEQTLAHFLHMAGPGSGLIGHLQSRSQRERERAGDLIRLGVPCRDTELSAFLDMTEGQIYADTDLDLRSASGLAAHEAVQERMYTWLGREQTPARVRIAIVDILRERSPRARHQGAILLESVVNDEGRPGEVRREAAEVLARLGEPHTTTAVAALYTIASDRSATGENRNGAAAALASIGGRHRTTAADLLHQVAEDPGIVGWYRRQAAENLARLGPDARTRAAELLHRLAVDTAVDPSSRRSAAESLAALGGDHRRRAIAALQQSPSVGWAVDDSRLWSAAAALLKSGGRETAVDLLRQVCEDTSVHELIRLNAAKELAGLGGRPRADAARYMRDIAVSILLESTRYSAAAALVDLGPTFQGLSTEALTSVAEDSALDADARGPAARLLARYGGTAREVAVRTMMTLATTTGPELSGRADAALELANLDESHREGVTRLFREWLTDPRITPTNRILASVILISLEPDSTATGSETLFQLANSADGHHEARMLAANTLVELPGNNVDRAMELLITAANDLSSEEAQRQTAAVRLAEVGDTRRGQAAEFLRHLGLTTNDSYQYATALHELAELGDAYSAEASLLLARRSADPWIRDFGTAFVVYRLRDLSPASTEAAASLVAQIVDDPLRDEPSLFPDDVAMFDRCRPGVAAKIYAHKMRYGNFDVFESCEAAEELVRTDKRYRDLVVKELRATAVDMPDASVDRVLPLALAESLEADDRRAYSAVLANVVGNPDVVPRLAVMAARFLEKEDSALRGQVVGAFRRLSGDVRLYFGWRLWAMERLISHGSATIADSAHDLLSNPTLPFSERLRMSRLLAGAGVTAPSDRSILEETERAPVVDDDNRIAGAKAMLGLGAEHTDRAAAMLLGVMSDPVAPAHERLRAAQTLAGVDGLRASLGGALAERLLTEEHAGIVDRAVGAAFLAWMRPETRSLAGELLVGLVNGTRLANRLPIAAMLANNRGRVPVAERVRAEIAADPSESDPIRMEALEELAGSIGGREQSGVLAADIAADPTVAAEIRVRAAILFARVRPEERARAIAELNRIADSVTADVERVKAAHLVAKADRGQRDRLADLLLALAEDPMQNGAVRREAATVLSRFGDEASDRAADALAALADDPSELSSERVEAVRGLLGMLRQRRRGLELLRGLAANRDQNDEERVSALWELVQIDTRERVEAATVMFAVATDPDVADGSRYLAVVALFEVVGVEDDRPATAARGLVADLTVGGHWRRQAAALLYRHGGVSRTESCDLLRWLATDRAVSASDRVEAIRDLMRFSPASSTLESLLGDLIQEPGVAASDRCRAAVTLAGFGEPARVDAIRLLAGQAERADAFHRFAMLDQLCDLGPSARGLAGRQLRELAASPGGHLVQAIASARLVSVDGEHDGRAVRRLTAVATDTENDANSRLWAVAWLVRLGPVHVELATDLLITMTDGPGLRVWERLAAAQLMARLGSECRRRAASSLAVLIRADAGDAWERADCAVARESLGTDNRAETLEILAQLALDPAVGVDEVGYIARQLMIYGPEARPTAVAALKRVATDRNADSEGRAEAAATLIQLGGDHATTALDVFGELTSGARQTEFERALARAALAEVRPAEQGTAVQALTAVARDPSASVEQRGWAASKLAGLSIGARRAGLEVLRGLAAGPVTDAQMALVKADLARWDASIRPAAAAAVERFVSEPADGATLVGMAGHLAWLAADPSHGASLLHRYARDLDFTPEVRRRAHRDWVARSPEWNWVGPARLR
ncbi:hypothetical protein KOI35_21440 [Actinoplanes bogorensis]|uniref:NACHT domain-containing protein n=1 Tax=Paractinoplanes bogorensis TaxID=1610840 RepID=A0ABS5YRL4_9ACTN|nr:hypothetical protein [Actinoplanes bogorensis]MBU2666082.1 hypothetical protein [Actinoplanes bogorensis]